MVNNYPDFTEKGQVLRMADYQKPKKGQWVVRKADYRKAGGDINECEWLLVASVKRDNISGVEMVTVENYGSETGDITTETGRIDEFVCTGVQEPESNKARILSGIESLGLNLSDEEWKILKMMVEDK